MFLHSLDTLGAKSHPQTWLPKAHPRVCDSQGKERHGLKDTPNYLPYWLRLSMLDSGWEGAIQYERDEQIPTPSGKAESGAKLTQGGVAGKFLPQRSQNSISQGLSLNEE